MLALLADRRHGLGRQVLPARRPGAVGREHLGRVRQGEQLGVERVVEPAGEVVGGDSDRRQQVRAADVADEQGVTGQHAVRVAETVVHDDADRLRRVARRLADLQRHAVRVSAELDAVAVAEGDDRELGPALGGPSVADRRPGPFRELEVPGQEVGVEVGLEDLHDRQAVLGGVDHRRHGVW